MAKGACQPLTESRLLAGGMFDTAVDGQEHIYWSLRFAALETLAGWWFGTFVYICYFSIYIYWECHHPN